MKNEDSPQLCTCSLRSQN